MSMVVCEQCKTVVFAYDHETRPIAGILNLLNMVCPKCGGVRTFDGWDGDLSWEYMRAIANNRGYSWEPDDQNRWFGGMTSVVADLFKLDPPTREVVQKMFEELERRSGQEATL